MKKSKMIVARKSSELAEALDLSPADVVEWEVRSILNEKSVQLVDESRITHVHLAKLAGTSRPRITALLNRRRRDISTDLMFRVLASLGYSAKLSFKKIAG